MEGQGGRRIEGLVKVWLKLSVHGFQEQWKEKPGKGRGRDW